MELPLLQHPQLFQDKRNVQVAAAYTWRERRRGRRGCRGGFWR
jgi:hypothetical protein